MHKSDKHIPALDGIRGLAVLLVIFYHTGGGAKSSQPIVHSIGVVNKYGWTGVTLFFVLSGFLITGILWDTRDDPHHLKNFYARRSLRIFPLYYFALILVVIGSIPTGQIHDCFRRLWVYVLYLQNVDAFGLHPHALPSPMITVHFWSLAVEEQFYLIWPAVILRMKTLRQTQGMCAAVFVVSSVAQFIYSFSAAPLPHNESLWANAGGLALGGYIAIGIRRKQDFTKIAHYLMPISLVVFIAGTLGSNRVRTIFDLTTISLSWGCLVVLCLSPGMIRRTFEVPWLRWVGTISYGMYIYHWLFRTYYEWIAWKIYPHASDSAHQGLRFLITFILTIGISWLSFTYFERPISKLKRHFHSRTPVGATM
jgi:peptidoglycan/LPS O-acetylase OafA/YrhL